MGGVASAALVAILAYLGPVDPGGPLQYGMRNLPLLESGILSIYGGLTGLFVGGSLCIITTMLNKLSGYRSTRGEPPSDLGSGGSSDR